MSLETATEGPFGHVVRQMNKAMEQMQKGYFSYCPAETWTPQVNLYENDTAYLVCVDLSGVDKEKIELTVSEGTLKLRGHRNVPAPAGMGGGEGFDADGGSGRVRIHLMEIDYGQFCREVQLPQDVAVDRIAAAHVNGLLWVELPKR